MALTKIGATLGGSADVITVTQSSHGLYLGYPVKMTSSGYAHATADTAANAEAVGIVIATDRTGNNTTFSLALGGRVTVDGCVPNLTAGTVLFLQVSAGLLAAAEPSGNTQVSKPMAVITIANSEMIMVQQRGEVISTAGITLADESVDSDHYVDGSIDNIHLATGIDAVKLADGSVTNTELQYINTLSSNAQVQISAKAAVGSGTPSTQTLPDTAATGSSTEAARLDHVHTMPAAGGDLSFGGDTFGADKVIGSNDAYALSFETAGVVRMKIEGAAGSYTAAGAITMPTQPCVHVTSSTYDEDVSGQGQMHVVDYNVEQIDQGGDWANDTFTTPVTGTYFITATLRLEGVTTSSQNLEIQIDTSNGTDYNFVDNRSNTGYTNVPLTVTAAVDLDAGDTFQIQFKGTGENEQRHDVTGGTGTEKTVWMSCVLLA